jgi:hypothetical protein
MTYAIHLPLTNGTARTAASQAGLEAATGLTVRFLVKGQTLVPDNGFINELLDISDASGTGTTGAKCMLVLSQDTSGNISPIVFVGGTGLQAFASYAATAITDLTAWYEVLWTYDASGATDKRQFIIWKRGTAAPIFEYHLNFAVVPFSTTAGQGIVSFGRTLSLLYGDRDTDWDFVAIYAGSPYSTSNAGTNSAVPPFPTGTDSGIVDCWLLEENTGTTSANSVAGGPALTLANATWEPGYGAVPQVPTQIAVTQQASRTVTTGVAFPQQPKFEVRDVSGVAVVGYSGYLTVSLFSGGAALSGTQTVQCVNGVATFTNLAFAGNGLQRLVARTTSNTGVPNADVPYSDGHTDWPTTDFIHVGTGSAVASVLLNPYEGQACYVGDTQTFRMEAYDATDALTTSAAPSYTSSSPATATIGAATGLLTAVAAGTTTITGTIGAFSATCTVQVLALDVNTPITPVTTIPVTEADTPCAGRVVTCTTEAQVRAALAPGTLQYGDKIVIDPAVVIRASNNGNQPVTIPKPVGARTDWVWITTSGTLPAEGVRVQGTESFPQILGNGNGAMGHANGCQRVRWRGITFGLESTCPDPQPQANIYIGYATEQTLKAMPHNIILDRCNNVNSVGVASRNGVSINCRRVAVIDSRIRGWRAADYAAYDTNAVGGATCMGPVLLRNNDLEGSVENVAFASDTMNVPVQLADVQIYGNYISKRLAWRTLVYHAKNIIEFKKGLRVHIRGNILENSWVEGQTGQGVYIRAGTVDSASLQIVTRDVTVEYNWVKVCMTMLEVDSQFQAGGPQLDRVVFQHNLGTGIGSANTYSPAGLSPNIKAFWITSNQGQGKNVQWRHNTVLMAFPTPGYAQVLALNSGATSFPGIKLRNNIAGVQGAYMLSSAEGINNAWTNYGGGIAANFAGNVAPYDSAAYTNEGTNYRVGSAIPCADFAAIGLVGGASAALSLTAPITDYALASTSAFKGKSRNAADTATDGTDPGVDITTLFAYTANALIGGATPGNTATQLVMATQPSPTAVSGVALAQQPVVWAEDGGGARVASDTSTVTATLVVLGGSGTPIGTLTKACVAGIADFTANGLGVISATGGRFAWAFTDGSLTSVQSDAFTVPGSTSWVRTRRYHRRSPG